MDVIGEHGPALLGSRLKRLGERMQVGAARIIANAGLPLQPTHMPFLFALAGRALTIGQLVQAVGISQPGVTRTVGQLVRLGIVRSDPGADQRLRAVSLTAAGEAALAHARAAVLPRAEQAVRTLLGAETEPFLARLAALEAALEATPLDRIAPPAPPPLVIREYSDELAPHFRAISLEWISTMFRVEPIDLAVVDHPREAILDAGGDILFVEAPGLGVIGTGALMPDGEGGIELTKMGVTASARGLKAGETLLAALIARAEALGADPLYLLTNARCAAAIHLYEKLGFRHDAGIMAKHGTHYERCDVAMRYAPGQ